MSNLATGSPYDVPFQAIAGVTPIVGIVRQVGNNRIIAYQLFTDGTVDGAWKIEVSNDFALDAHVSMGNVPTPGLWTDVTVGFKKLDGTALAAVVHGTPATQNQFVQCAPIGARVVRVTFTPSAGAGNVRAACAGGSY
jgi:hypothetical protein